MNKQQHTCPTFARHACALAVLAALGAATPAGAVTYTVLDLGTLGGAAYVNGLNNLGQVVGSYAIGGTEHAFSWTASGGMVDIHYPSGPDGRSRASAVNDSGTVVTNLFLPDGSAYGMTWKNGTQTFLPTTWAPAGYSYFQANGINNAGVIVGVAAGATVPTLSFISNPALGGSTGALAAQGGDSLRASAINNQGSVAGDYVNGLSGGGFIWRPGSGYTTFDTRGYDALVTAMNDREQIVGVSYVDGANQAYLWQPGRAAISLGLGAGASLAFGINNAGQVVGSRTTGGFLWTARGGMQDINALLTPGTTIRVLSAKAINESGQIAGQGSDGRAVLLTPTGDLAWLGNGGAFEDGANWELGLSPSRYIDAQVYTAGVQTLTLGRDAQVNSLGLGAASGGRPTLLLQGGSVLDATYSVTVRATGTLVGDGAVNGGVVNLGTVLASNLRITGGLQNQGLVGMQGGTPGVLQAELVNQPGGQLRVNATERLQLIGTAHRNEGTFELRGGELAIAGTLDNAATGRVLLSQGGVLRAGQGVANSGQINVGFGGAEVFGNVVNRSGSQIVLSGNSNTTFYDAVTVESGGELRVSAGSTALFFGLVRQNSGAVFSGTGTKFYEGKLFVGNSPGLGVDEGSVVFGGASVYTADIGGTEVGTGYDKLVIGGALQFGGTLKLQSWAGFVAQAGQHYDLFDWSSSSGRFSAIDSSGLALADGLVLDTSRLYVDGSITVTAVPEPAAGVLMAGGLALLLCVRRRGG